MNFETGREIALIGIRLLDDAYMAWEAAEVEAEHALHGWSEGGQHRTAYQSYRRSGRPRGGSRARPGTPE
jgi:hypothetical protein